MGFVKLQLVAKYEKKLRGTIKRYLKISEKKFEMRFSNSVTVPKNVIGGPLGFFGIHSVAKYRNKRKGDPLVESKKVQKKSQSAEKYPSEKHRRRGGEVGGSYVFEVLDVDVIVLDEVLAFRVCFGRP